MTRIVRHHGKRFTAAPLAKHIAYLQRAGERVSLELRPRTEQEIRSGLEREVEADRWTSLDRALRELANESGGIVDLRPGGPGEDPELRRLLIGRAKKLE